MVRGMIFASVLVCASGPAFSAECVQPYAPTIPNGASATKDQMLSAQNEVKVFLKASDTYQECMLRDIQVRRAEAAHNQKPFDQSIADAATRDIDYNQREKERVGAEYNTAVHAYSTAHPQ